MARFSSLTQAHDVSISLRKKVHMQIANEKKNVDMGKRDLGALINLCYFIFSNIAIEEKKKKKIKRCFET